MYSLDVSKSECRNYLINRQNFNSFNSINEVINFFGCLQVDPISVVAKTHELSLFWRVPNYQIGDIDKYLYIEKLGFEYWQQQYSILPNCSYSYLESIRKFRKNRYVDFYSHHKKTLDLICTHIKNNTQVTTADLSHFPKGSGIRSWKDIQNHSGYLHYLWEIGEIIISNRKGLTKYYEPSTNRYSIEKYSLNIQKQYLFTQAFKYIGLCRLPFLNRNSYAKTFKLKNFLLTNEVINLNIDGNKKYFILSSELENFKKISQIRSDNLTVIVPPLDPLVIDRELVSDLWNYHYRWNVYTKPELRRGFYNMPVLHKNNFIGDISLKKNYSSLEIEYCSFDPKIIKQELNSLTKFVFPNNLN